MKTAIFVLLALASCNTLAQATVKFRKTFELLEVRRRQTVREFSPRLVTSLHAACC